MIRVLIVDDSALMRRVISEILSRDPAIQVVGTASDAGQARDKVLALQPDVITLDVEMPRMDGLSFLERLMRAKPTPTIMISSLTERSCDTTIRALDLGAVDFVTKPKLDVESGTLELAAEIIAKVKIAAGAKVANRKTVAPPPLRATIPTAEGPSRLRTTDHVVALGASTGGTEALREVLQVLPPDSPGIVIVQHMPERFTTSFAARLNDLCRIHVQEARNGDRILPGHALLAPGNFHAKVHRSGGQYYVEVFQAPPVNRHRPSVDVLFHSCAESLGPNATAAILTGMGNDGARGMKAMRDQGAHTIAQDEQTCVVFGMPKEAIALNGACEILPLGRIPAAILRAAAKADMA